jgi:hypothetical protein
MSFAPIALPELRVDPAQLHAAADGVRAAASELSAAVTVVNAAWIAASSGLVETRSGLALGACRLPVLSAVRSWADAVADLAAELSRAATGYRTDDVVAVPASRLPS